MKIDLLSDASATGNAVSVAFGGRYLLAVAGTFSGATVKAQFLGPDGSTFMDVPDSSKTAAGTAIVYLPAETSVKGIVTGGTSPAGLYLSIYRIPE